jgi:hypothetical protein
MDRELSTTRRRSILLGGPAGALPPAPEELEALDVVEAVDPPAPLDDEVAPLELPLLELDVEVEAPLPATLVVPPHAAVANTPRNALLANAARLRPIMGILLAARRARVDREKRVALAGSTSDLVGRPAASMVA